KIQRTTGHIPVARCGECRIETAQVTAVQAIELVIDERVIRNLRQLKIKIAAGTDLANNKGLVVELAEWQVSLHVPEMQSFVVIEHRWCANGVRTGATLRNTEAKITTQVAGVGHAERFISRLGKLEQAKHAARCIAADHRLAFQ